MRLPNGNESVAPIWYEGNFAVNAFFADDIGGRGAERGRTDVERLEHREERAEGRLRQRDQVPGEAVLRDLRAHVELRFDLVFRVRELDVGVDARIAELRELGAVLHGLRDDARERRLGGQLSDVRRRDEVREPYGIGGVRKDEALDLRL